ncbi:MAG TPA: hypothetical protein VMT85_07825 [Thermoanaerobaculia bacterium]|nr:hypothetical protein [Thermoanaerobaculia bacterium]
MRRAPPTASTTSRGAADAVADDPRDRTKGERSLDSSGTSFARRRNLYQPVDDGEERGIYPHHVAESSLYTQAMLHPRASTLLLLGIGAVAVAWSKR